MSLNEWCLIEFPLQDLEQRGKDIGLHKVRFTDKYKKQDNEFLNDYTDQQIALSVCPSFTAGNIKTDIMVGVAKRAFNDYCNYQWNLRLLTDNRVNRRCLRPIPLSPNGLFPDVKQLSFDSLVTNHYYSRREQGDRLFQRLYRQSHLLAWPKAPSPDGLPDHDTNDSSAAGAALRQQGYCGLRFAESRVYSNMKRERFRRLKNEDLIVHNSNLFVEPLRLLTGLNVTDHCLPYFRVENKDRQATTKPEPYCSVRVVNQFNAITATIPALYRYFLQYVFNSKSFDQGYTAQITSFYQNVTEERVRFQSAFFTLPQFKDMLEAWDDLVLWYALNAYSEDGNTLQTYITPTSYAPLLGVENFFVIRGSFYQRYLATLINQHSSKFPKEELRSLLAYVTRNATVSSFYPNKGLVFLT